MKHRDHLPQLDGGLFLTDGGIETTLIFHEGLDLPLFAAFDLLKDDEGTEALRRYFEPYVELARERRRRLRAREPDLAGESPLGHASSATRTTSWTQLNRKAIALMEELRERYESAGHADRDQRLRRTAGRRLQPGARSSAPRRPRTTTRPRSGPSPRPPPTWSRRSR